MKDASLVKHPKNCACGPLPQQKGSEALLEGWPGSWGAGSASCSERTPLLLPPGFSSSGRDRTGQGPAEHTQHLPSHQSHVSQQSVFLTSSTRDPSPAQGPKALPPLAPRGHDFALTQEAAAFLRNHPAPAADVQTRRHAWSYQIKNTPKQSSSSAASQEPAFAFLF